MKINVIKIEKLFGLFDYNISFKNNENLLIITGPNGYGKTMILNIIFNLFSQKFSFFQKLIFDNIKIYLAEDNLITISKNTRNEKAEIKIGLYKREKEVDTINYSEKLESEIEKSLRKYFPISRFDPDTWIDLRTERKYTTDEILLEYADQLPDDIKKNLLSNKSGKLSEIIETIKVHLIREQRLFKRVRNVERNYREDREQTIMIETIQTYAKDLKLLMAEKLQQSFKISQQLDSSYPDRLVKEKKKLTESEYNVRFEKLKIKQEKLAKNGLYERKQQFLGYSEDDSKALLVYLNDLEQKLGVFDNLLEKLELFTGILNERRFTFKSIKVDREKGFFFITTSGKELLLNQLSSGEQHEVVLLYELIFNASPNTLVLIDEPEISLHITWQKEFLNDLLRIIDIQNIQVLIATHAPSIINDRWDLVYNLEKNIN